MRSYFKMKYEQFLMRLFDRLVNIMMKDEDLSWYPKFVVAQDLEEVIDRKDDDIEDLWQRIIEKDDEICRLEYDLYLLERGGLA